MEEYIAMNALIPFALLALGLLLIIWITLTRIERRLRENDYKVDLLVRHAGIDPSKPAEPSDRVRLLAQQPSQRIEAIKAYREESGADLRAAKAMIESLQNPVGR
jgi:ribosomal protein L7/L12